jgi:hypothetical protein
LTVDEHVHIPLREVITTDKYGLERFDIVFASVENPNLGTPVVVDTDNQGVTPWAIPMLLVFLNRLLASLRRGAHYQTKQHRDCRVADRADAEESHFRPSTIQRLN